MDSIATTRRAIEAELQALERQLAALREDLQALARAEELIRSREGALSVLPAATVASAGHNQASTNGASNGATMADAVRKLIAIQAGEFTTRMLQKSLRGHSREAIRKTVRRELELGHIVATREVQQGKATTFKKKATT